MLQKIKIVGGKSTANRISILSDEFIATARSNNKDGEITCKVSRHSPLSRFLHKNKHFPIPRLVRMILFVMDSMTWKGWAFFSFYTISVVMMNNFLPPGFASNLSVSALLKQYWPFYAVIFLGVFLYIRLYIATWHGAEHMAISAYARSGTTDSWAIACERPINDKCGGRLFFPLVVGTIISELIAEKFGINKLLVSLITIECILWIDVLKGWDKIPVASQVSYFLQRFITTCPPAEQELRTAQKALQELIAAHNINYLK